MTKNEFEFVDSLYFEAQKHQAKLAKEYARKKMEFKIFLWFAFIVMVILAISGFFSE